MTDSGHETMTRLTRKTAAPKATVALGEAVGRSLVGGLTIGLVGPLGSGKTLLVKGIASGNAVGDVRRVTSPTFALVHEYPGRLRLYHVDVYRLEGPKALAALGFDEWLEPAAVVVIEWADRVRSLVPDGSLWIEFAPTGSTTRSVSFVADDGLAVRCLEAIRAELR